MGRYNGTEAVELNIGQILKLLLRFWWVVVLSCALLAGGAFGVSKYLIVPEYESSMLFYVNNMSFAEDDRLSGSDMDASKSLVDTYMVILNTRQTLEQVIGAAGADISADELQAMLSANAVERTELLRVTVRGRDANAVGRLAQALGTVFPQRVGAILSGSHTSLAEPARMPTSPSSPNVLRNTVSGFLSGAVLGCSLVLLWAMRDVTIRNEEKLTQLLDCPVLARVPELPANTGSRGAVGHRLNKPGQEAYKTLRTRLEYVLAHAEGSRVVGISSAMAGEGKTTSAANLAYAMSQLGSRVLLLECDLRRPSLHQKLPLSPGAGLSEYLSGQAELEEVQRLCTLRGGSFSVIRAGRVPPNPGELLNSRRMEELIARLRKEFDYILLDLPPVGEVSDAMIAARFTDGMLLVVRRNYCSGARLRAAVGQLAAVETKILGILFNCAQL